LVGLDQVSDREIWEYARREGYLIVTKDADFSDLCMLLGFPPKVIWIRRKNCKTSGIEIILRQHRVDIKALDEDDTLGVLTLL
jgi:predicted nuclease of predicted toxin-antitoxin system